MRTKKTMVTLNHTTTQVSAKPVSFQILQSFKRIKDIAAYLHVSIPPRRAFGYIGNTSIPYKLAVWCPSLDPHPEWENKLQKGGQIFVERKIGTASRNVFQNRVQNLKYYDAEIIRMTFVKIKKRYYFAGFYRMSTIDFDNQMVTYSKLDVQMLSANYKKKTITITIEEDEVYENIFVFQ